MSENKYQVWEGEMEAQHFDTSDATLATVIFSAMLGIILFLILLCKTGLETMLKNTADGKEKHHRRSIDGPSHR